MTLRQPVSTKQTQLGLSRPPKKLLGSGFSTPYILFCLICTSNSELKYFPICAHLSELGSISTGFQWMGSTPAGFQEAFRAALSLSLGCLIDKDNSQTRTIRSVKRYEVASLSRLLQIIGLFCRIQSLLQGSFAKETYTFKEPTNRSRPIAPLNPKDKDNARGYLLTATINVT